MKSKLRHPIRAIREPFGTAGLIVAVIALVAALAGGAYAAGGLTGKQKKEVTKIAKKYAGKPGATGPAGPAGPAGASGKDGANGQDGAAGTNGVSVTSQAATAGECPAGGTKFTSASGTSAVCNGKNGTTGFTETLPSGKTETGTWGFGAVAPAATPAPSVPSNGLFSFISFAVPLETDLPPETAHYIAENGKELKLKINSSFEIEGSEAVDQASPAPCPGSVEAPEALPGHLCVYEAYESDDLTITSEMIGKATGDAPPPLSFGVGRTGAMINAYLINKPTTEVKAWGTWAVTAP